MTASPAPRRATAAPAASKRGASPAAVPSSRRAATALQRVAVVGAGMAGVVCARTLMQAGLQVTLFEKSRGFGGRMSTRQSPFGSFDHGVQYFTVRDPRFERALATTPQLVRRWSANAVRVLDEHGRVVEAALPAREPHWVAVPGMNALVRAWAQPLADVGAVHLQERVWRIERDSRSPRHWQLRCAAEGASGDAIEKVYAGFDAVLLAVPSVQARELLEQSQLAPTLLDATSQVSVAPCWTLMLAFPQAQQPSTLGPQWNAALSTHHRIAWLARESSKPQRDAVERWTVQAGAAWSREHLEDDPARVQAKLLKAFAEVTGIHAEPQHVQVHRWRYAKTDVALGRSHLWDARFRIGLSGDWCLGHRVEHAFVSGLELALRVSGHKA